MRFISDDKVRYLGKRKMNNENGSFYSINACDESGTPSRFYCSEEVFDDMNNMQIEFGEEITMGVDIAFYNNRFSARVISVNRI